MVKLGKEGRTAAIFGGTGKRGNKNPDPFAGPKKIDFTSLRKLALVHSHKTCLWHFCRLFFRGFLLKKSPPMVHLLPIQNKHRRSGQTFVVGSDFRIPIASLQKNPSLGVSISAIEMESLKPPKTPLFFSHPKSKVAFFLNIYTNDEENHNMKVSSHHPRKNGQYLPSYHIAILNLAFFPYKRSSWNKPKPPVTYTNHNDLYLRTTPHPVNSHQEDYHIFLNETQPILYLYLYMPLLLGWGVGSKN